MSTEPQHLGTSTDRAATGPAGNTAGGEIPAVLDAQERAELEEDRRLQQDLDYMELGGEA